MDLIDQCFRWHRRFAAPVHCGPQLLLLAEHEPLLFESPVIQALSALLEQGQSLREHLMRPPAGALPALSQAFSPAMSPAMSPALLQALSSLLAAGHAQTREAHASAPYLLPDFEASVSPQPEWMQGARVWRLSQAIGDDVIAACIDAAAGEGDRFTWVFCDDLLDPRLADVDAWHRARGLPWLPLRLAGTQPSIGPVFDPAMAGHACWHCLAARLRRQHAARTWARPYPSLLAIPILIDPGRLATRPAWITPEALHSLAGPTQHIHTWHETASAQPAIQRHLLVKRPQCAHCGDAGLRARRQLEAIELAPRTTLPDAPGGSRCTPPERLTDRKDALVSGLLGPVIELAPVTPPEGQAAGHLAIYRSAFIRPPAPGAPLPRGGFVQTCLGKGRTPAQSQASALGEAIERLSAAWHGDEATVTATARALGPAAITPSMLARVQAAHEPGLDGAPSSQPAPAEFDPDAPMRWAPAWSLTHGERRYLPAGHCFRDMPAEDSRHIAWTSNGCAAGGNREEAILQGLLEVIERDATAIWWYGMVPRPAWPSAHMPADLVSRLSTQLGEGWRLWTLDLTHDLGVPVAAAVAHHEARDDWALGFGCHPAPRIAAERALTELAQLAAVNKCLRLGSQNVQFLQIAHDAVRSPNDCPEILPTDMADQIRFLVAQLHARGFETIVLDHTLPDLPLHAVKTTVPGLCHIWPEARPSGRLLTVPAGLNWLTEPAKASQLNPRPLFV